MSKKTMKKKNTLEVIFSIVFAIIVGMFILQLFLLDKLPFLYNAIITLVLVLISLGLIALQFGKKINKTNKTLGKIIMVILGGLLIFGNVYIYKTRSAISNIVDEKPSDKIEVSVYVLKDSPLQSIEELSKEVGIIKVGNAAYVNQSIDEIKKINDSFEIVSYTGFDRFADALYNGTVEAIILESSFATQFEEKHPNFFTDTRVLTNYYYDEVKQDISISVDVTKDTFAVYLTGIDQKGKIGVRGRSDVNKVMVVNPNTRQILIVDIPRDYYIQQPCQFDQKDKLTHSGIFGVDCTVQSVSNYMGVDINYYLRVNFSSLEKIVNALGGIEVYSDYSFSALNGEFYFSKGVNYLNGAEALAFSRERYTLPNGDFDRIQNQTKVLKGMINKAISPTIITNYLDVLEAISGTFQTNLSEKEINDLIKMQLNDMRGWSIISDQLSGKGGTDWTPANGFDAYVCYPDGTSLERVLGKIKTIKENGILE